MSQVVLGLRSLAIKLAIFVVMAALLAWALGGTLFPKPTVLDFPQSGVTVIDTAFEWRLIAPADRDQPSHWQFTIKTRNGTRRADDVEWREPAGPVLIEGTVYYGGLSNADGWVIRGIHPGGSELVREQVPDRLAVEQQLQRLKNGLVLQDSTTILQQRSAVLDPKPTNADLPGAGMPEVGDDATANDGSD